MKKITFILFALIAGTTYAQTGISSAAEIIETISFAENSGLNFGRVDNSAGTVIIDYTGTPSGKTQMPGGTTSAGDLTVSGEADESYILTVSETATLENPDLITMNVTAITHNASRVLDADGEEKFQIKGTLNVNAGQATGLYTGEISVTVSYN